MLATSFERSCCSVPADRLVDDRRRRAAPAGAVVGLVQRLRAVDSRAPRVPVRRFRPRRLRRQRLRRSRSGSVCRFARVSVLSASSTWSSWTGSEVWVIGIVWPRGDRLRRRAAGLQFDEPVAFEEDARADLQRRVACGSAGRAISISIVTRPVLPSRLIDVTLPTLTPAMRTGDFGLDVDGGGEHGVQAEAVFERDVLGEAEVHDDREDHDHDHDPKRSGLARCSSTTGTSSWRRHQRHAAHFAWLLSLSSPSALSVGAGYFSPKRLFFAVGDFAVCCATLPGEAWPITCLADRVVARCRLRTACAGPGRRRSGRGSRAGGCC